MGRGPRVPRCLPQPQPLTAAEVARRVGLGSVHDEAEKVNSLCGLWKPPATPASMT